MSWLVPLGTESRWKVDFARKMKLVGKNEAHWKMKLIGSGSSGNQSKPEPQGE